MEKERDNLLAKLEAAEVEKRVTVKDLNDRYKAEIREKDQQVMHLKEVIEMRMREIYIREQTLDERERMLVERERALKKKK